MANRRPQLSLDLLPRYGWGGSRKGAGRRPRGEEAGVPHERRLALDRHTPVHVTLRAREHVWNLRSRRCHAVISAALRGVLARAGFRIVHFSVQGNHLHLIVEADDAAALARGMRAVSGRIAIGLNRLMGTRGRVFSDRYHAHVLRTRAEVRNAVTYVLGNFVSHRRREGEPIAPRFVDPFSSAAPRGPDGEPPPVSPPESWLLRSVGLAANEAEAEHSVARATRSRRAERSSREASFPRPGSQGRTG